MACKSKREFRACNNSRYCAANIQYSIFIHSMKMRHQVKRCGVNLIYQEKRIRSVTLSQWADLDYSALVPVPRFGSQKPKWSSACTKSQTIQVPRRHRQGSTDFGNLKSTAGGKSAGYQLDSRFRESTEVEPDGRDIYLTPGFNSCSVVHTLYLCILLLFHQQNFTSTTAYDPLNTFIMPPTSNTFMKHWFSAGKLNHPPRWEAG